MFEEVQLSRAFKAGGPSAMLETGGWSSVGGSRPYVSQETFTAGLQAQTVVDDSDPDS